MLTPLQELEARLDELAVDAQFLSLAARLRPRLGDVVRWDAGGEVVELARTFMSAHGGRAEARYAALLVRVLAVFERYVRRLIDSIVERRSAAAQSYDKVPSALGNRNVALTGRVLSAIDMPRDHLSFNFDALIDNLASCRPGSTTFRLNSQVFSAVVTGAGPAVIERALQNVDITEWWDAVGASPDLVKALGTKGARATGEQAKERLKELWRWRNHLAHGGDEEIVLSEVQLREAIAFIGWLGAALDKAANQRLKAIATK